jgi:hypothetical protein
MPPGAFARWAVSVDQFPETPDCLLDGLAFTDFDPHSHLVCVLTADAMPVDLDPAPNWV